jgi:predicted alpha/beta superfamily hydrolase
MTAWLASILVPLILLCSFAASAQDAEHVKIDLIVRVPAATTGKVFVSGSIEPLGLWKPDGLALDRTDAATHRSTLLLKKGTRFEFKVTRGTWETVERGEKGEDIENRLCVADADKTVSITVANWSTAAATPRAERKSTQTGDIRLHDAVHSKLLDNDRRVWVWLPPTYEKETDARYPVLYMHDGQNVFDNATSFAGEWRADETAMKLIQEERIKPLIIVAIENNAHRMEEYTAAPTKPGRGDLYARFLLEELKPLIDKTYRSLPDRAHTAVAGSSLGGLISLYIAAKYPDHVGLAAVISPALWWDDKRLLTDLSTETNWMHGTKFWLDMGTKEGTDPDFHLRNSRDLAKRFRADPTLREGRDFTYHEIEDAPHNESAWSARFDQVLEFLFKHE